MALVISRHSSEHSPPALCQFRIGDDVIVTVLRSSADNVRLAIQAPREILVHREEIYQRIIAEQKRGTAVKNAETAI